MKALVFILALLTALPAHAVEKRKLSLVTSGAILAGIFYVMPLALAIRYQEGELAVPVLGPLVDLRRCHECTSGPIGQGEVAGLVLDALFQAGGVALLVAGVVQKHPPRVTVAPLPTGIVVGGRF